jgi:Transcription termination factor nusG
MVGETFSAAYSATISGASTGVMELAQQPHWYAIRTRSRHEKIVADQLRSLGMERFLPVVKRSHKWTDRQGSRIAGICRLLFCTHGLLFGGPPGGARNPRGRGFCGHEECRLADSGWSDSRCSKASCERRCIRRACLSTGRAAGENSRRNSGWNRGHSLLARPRSEPGRFPGFDPEIAVGSNSRI